MRGTDPAQRAATDAEAPTGPRLGQLLAVLAHERLHDRPAFPLLGEDGPGDEVHQGTETVEDAEHAEQQPNEIDVNLEVRSESRADPGKHPPLLWTGEPAAPAAVVFAHALDDAHTHGSLSSGITLFIP